MRGTQARMGKRDRNKKAAFARKCIACIMTLLMTVCMVPWTLFVKNVNASTTSYIWESSIRTPFSKGTIADGGVISSISYKEGYNVIGSSDSEMVRNNATFDDGYIGTVGLNFGDKVTSSKNAITFKNENTTRVKVWWSSINGNDQLVILDNFEQSVAETEEKLQSGRTYISTMQLSTPGMYYLGSAGDGCYIYKVELLISSEENIAERASWESVEAPEISGANTIIASSGKRIISVSALVGYDGADELILAMTDPDGNVTEMVTSETGESHSFYPTFSVAGTYNFSARAIRIGEPVKYSSNTKTYNYTLKLTAPEVRAVNLGNGNVKVSWNTVTGAKQYKVTANDSYIITADTSIILEGLNIGEFYTITVNALTETSTGSDGKTTIFVKEEPATAEFAYSTYGSSTAVTATQCYSSYEYADDGSLYLKNNYMGLISPDGADGLSFYYTALDSNTQKFKLSADIHVDISEGGFGLVVSDAVGKNGDSSVFWNNSYQVAVAKFEYYHKNELSGDLDKIKMSQGFAAIVKNGVSFNDNLLRSSNIPFNFNSQTDTLETSCAEKGTGTYDIVADNNHRSETSFSDFKFSIELNDNVYTMSVYNTDGSLIGQKSYTDADKNSLIQIDKDNIYVGIFTAGNAKITVSNLELIVDGAFVKSPSNEKFEYINPDYSITSADTSASSDYNLAFHSNAYGMLTVEQNGIIIYTDNAVVAGKDLSIPTTLANGDNLFNVTFTPNEYYMPDTQTKLSSYNTATLEHKVTYNSSEGTDNKDNGNNNSGSGNTDNKNNNTNDNDIGDNNSNNTDKGSGSGNIADNSYDKESVADKNGSSNTNNSDSKNVGNNSSSEIVGNGNGINSGITNNGGNSNVDNATENNGNDDVVTDINSNNGSNIVADNSNTIAEPESFYNDYSNNILTSDDISGADNIQIDDVGFTQIGDATLSASEIMSAINDNGQIVADVDVMQTSQEINKSVLENVNDTSADSIAIFASEDASISADVINSLVKTGKTLSVGIVDKNGKVNAILTLDGNDLTSATSDFELAITVDTQDIGVTTLMANYEIPMSSYSIIGFDYSGNLPGTFKVAVDVSDKFADGTQLALYYNNSVTGALENQYQVTTVSGGYAEFAINHCSEYVLMDVSAARSMITSSTLTSPKTGDTSHIVFWISMMGAVLAILGGIEACASERKRR